MQYLYIQGKTEEKLLSIPMEESVMSSRRDFIRNLAGSAALIGLTGLPSDLLQNMN